MITATTAIYLADTMGELGLFYALTEMVFMGGSLIAHGGQNPLEAARAHNAILTGPHTHNFASIIAQFEANAAIRIVVDGNELAEQIIALLKDDAAREAMAVNAQKTVEQSRGASSIILKQLSELMPRGGA